ncbi:hypothetical protein [Mucilaginibacter glaciei]|uniref:Uncharacterized protein n=1 Tax=Mucilaginibacter glaciei TaxID=2772109 RepID=A0A926NI85_9SPHI|nr:hypothetical protein [Mucilaginibacter glaciei]MBD1392564.1 hypothetical protein [Mucilaginibacter glaciei]
MKRWIAYGLVWAAFMFIWNSFISPLLFPQSAKLTWFNAAISLTISLIIGLLMSYILHRYFLKNKEQAKA